MPEENFINSVISSFDLPAFTSKYITHKLFGVASIGLKNAIKRINKNKEVLKIEKFDKEDCIEYISQHIYENLKWATNVSFRDAQKAKYLDDIFIELDLYIAPLKLKIDLQEKIDKISISDLLCDTEKNIILLGQPGAGKTTSVKKIFLELLSKEKDIYHTFAFPLVIRLKDLEYNRKDNGLILFRAILNTLGIFYSFETNLDSLAREKILVHVFKDFIERLDVLLIFDGFDEISDFKLRDEIIRNLRIITNSLLNSKYILTSRSADYDLHIENSTEYEICPLTENQIQEFIQNWLKNDVQSNKLLKQLKVSPYWDTTMRPLTLAHLCALYERNNSIPEKPKSVYKKIIQLLLEDWSNQRSIKRQSRYANFLIDRKMEFLARFAFELTVEYEKIAFNKNILNVIYSSICKDFSLPREDGKDVVKEIESHNGLILQTGLDNFEFAHKSLLEYLVAEYISRLPLMIKELDALLKIPNELAIWISISSNPNLTYYELVLSILKKECVNSSFLKSFLSRMKIEKPDFKPNLLFALTNIYLVNILAEKLTELSQEYNDEEIFEIYEEDIHEERHIIKKYEEEKEYFNECITLAIAFNELPSFKESLKDLQSYYKQSTITLGRKSSKKILENWGNVYLLTTFRKNYITQGIKIVLPEKIYLVEKFMI